jgi:two-component system, OmpR family, alkaline phosphatase synthesis response regulator PhoP
MKSELTNGRALMVKILIVEDDLETLALMEQYLEREGYTVLKTLSAREALNIAEESLPDLFVINTYLPTGMDGLMLCRKLRMSPRTVNTPIIFLTDQDTRHAVTEALEAGGDDYIRKPFALRELAARVRAHLRRVVGVTNDGTPLLRIIPDTLTVYVNERKVVLTQVEFELLKFLCRYPQQLHSTENLLMDVWQYPRGSGDAALVRNHIRNLRRKLEDDPERPSIIQSRHGRGYGVKARVHFETQAVSMHVR